MKLLDAFVLSTLLASSSAAPFTAVKRQTAADGLTLAQIDALTPPFGHAAGINPTGTGDCDGAVDGPDGQPLKVPCDCPPPRDQFIQAMADNINAGDVVNNPTVPFSFPTDNSTASILARFTAASVTLQNFKGLGVGCPESSTTWAAQAAAIQAGASDTGDAPPSTDAPPTTEAPPPTTEAPPATTAAPPATTEAPPPSSVTPPASSPATPSSSTDSAPPASSTAADGLTLAQIDALTPPFGHDAGVNPTGTGDCDGAVDDADGNPIKVPCDCPPPRDQFIQDLADNINAGKVVNNPTVPFAFPTDNSTASILARFNAAADTLQNLNGAGVGCPIVSTTWQAQQAAVEAAAQDDQANIAVPAASPAPAPAAPASAVSATAATASPSVTSAAGLSLAQIDALAPDLGFQAGVNPTGTGDCDGAVDGADGKPIKVPCSCPPSRDAFIQALATDIAAGHAVHNPSVPFSFPTDNSTASQIARVQASLVALQNLNGEGQGCPAASTTLSAQLKALQG